LPFGKQLVIDAEKSWTAAPNFLACGAPVEITFSGHDVSAVCRSERCPGANLGGSPRVLMKVENAVKVEPVGEFELKGIRRPLAAYNVVAAVSQRED
jgi:hypothetical protein